MQIVKVGIKNFLSVRDVELKPGKVVQIVGGNGQGKTTLLRAIEFAVKGSADGTLVRFGEDAAEVVVELDDQTLIRRRVTAEGKQSLDVRRDGFKAPSPQAHLDALFDGVAFNPLDLLDPKRRTDAIMSAIEIKVDASALAAELGVDQEKLPPLDYAQHGLKVIDQAHRFYYQRRAEANKDAAEKKKRWETYLADMPANTPSPSRTRQEAQQGVDLAQAGVAGATARLNDVRRAQEHDIRAKGKVVRYRTVVDDIDKQIAELNSRMEALKGRHAEGKRFLDEAIAEVPGVLPDETGALEGLRSADAELSQAKFALGEFAVVEAVANQKKAVDAMETEYRTSQAFAESLTEKVDALAGPVKKRLMAKAEMPVKELEYHDGGFRVAGVPVDNLSSSQAMRLAVGVARKLAKKTKIVCLDGAERLDEASYAALRAETEGDGYVYFISKVGEAFNDPTSQVVSMDKGNAEVRA